MSDTPPDARPDPGRPTDPVVEDGPDLHARRQRTTRRILLVGAVLSVLVALAIGAGGGSGQAGMVFLLLTLALTTGAAGLWATGTLLYDDLRKRGTTRRRIVTAVALFLVTGMLMAMVVGAGTAA